MTEMMTCRQRIEETFHTLPLKEKAVAELILKSQEVVVGMSIDEISTACGCSASAIVRLAKRLGYGGYKDLIRVLSAEVTIANYHEFEYKEIQIGDSEQDIFTNTCLGSVKTIENTMTVMNSEEFKKAVDLLCAAKRIDFYGVGSAGLVARDSMNKFIRINKYAVSFSDSHDQLLSIVGLTPDDVAVLISYSGETPDIIDLARQLKAMGVPTISLTRYGENSLSRLTDVKLYNSANESVIRIAAMSSRIGQLVVMDALYTAVCSRLYPRIKTYMDRRQEYSFSKHTESYQKK